MITFDTVYKWYHSGKAALPPVLGELSFTVGEGEFICVLCPSGCGKTTLLNLIAGFIAPSKGQVLFSGKEIHSPGPEREVAFQETTLFPWRTVWQNVAFGLEIRGVKGPLLQKTVPLHLEQMGLTDYAAQFPQTLSGHSPAPLPCCVLPLAAVFSGIRRNQASRRHPYRRRHPTPVNPLTMPFATKVLVNETSTSTPRCHATPVTVRQEKH